MQASAHARARRASKRAGRAHASTANGPAAAAMAAQRLRGAAWNDRSGYGGAPPYRSEKTFRTGLARSKSVSATSLRGGGGFGGGSFTCLYPRRTPPPP